MDYKTHMASSDDLPKVPKEDTLPAPEDQSVKVSSSELSISPSHNRVSLFAVFLLLFLGVGAFVYFSGSKQMGIAPETPEVAASPLFLTITSPGSSVTAVDGEILVSGQTLPNTAVIIFTDIDDTSADSNSTGTFEETVLVGDEGGLVRVTAYGENGEEESKTFEVVENKNVSLIESNILGKTDVKGQVKKEETSVLEKENSKPTAKPTPDAKTKKIISDFLVNKPAAKKVPKAGTAKVKSILDTEGTGSADLKGLKLKKLTTLIATSGATLKRHAVSGVITNVADGVLTIAHQIQRERISIVYYNESTIVSMKSVTTTGGATFAVGMRIAAVGTPAGDGLLAKRIHVIPGLAKGVFEKNPLASPSGSGDTTPTPSATASGTPSVTVEPTPEVSPTETETPTPTEPLSETPTPNP